MIDRIVCALIWEAAFSAMTWGAVEIPPEKYWRMLRAREALAAYLDCHHPCPTPLGWRRQASPWVHGGRA